MHPGPAKQSHGQERISDGGDRGVRVRPMKACTATAAINSAATAATTLTQEGMTVGTLTRASEAAQRPAPAQNTGLLAARSMEAPERISVSPATKTRNPA